jgi:hypothetical protein
MQAKMKGQLKNKDGEDAWEQWRLKKGRNRRRVLVGWERRKASTVK